MWRIFVSPQPWIGGGGLFGIRCPEGHDRKILAWTAAGTSLDLGVQAHWVRADFGGQVVEQFVKRFQLGPSRLPAVEFSNKCDGDGVLFLRGVLQGLGGNAFHPSACHENVTVSESPAVANDKMVGEAVGKTANPAVIVLQ